MFTVNMKDGYSPNYLKLLIQGINENANSNHIISFYQQDQTFQKREQFFKSSKNYTEMWFKKNKLNLTIECIDYPCDLYSISEIHSLDINIEDTYTYYITKETQEMTFNFIIDTRFVPDNL